MTTYCKCGKGHASPVDRLCKFCRESCWSRAEAKSVGVKHRGDGMNLDQQDKLKFKKLGWLC